MNLLKTTALALVLTLSLANAMMEDESASASSKRVRTLDTVQQEITAIVVKTGAAKRKGEELTSYLSTITDEFTFSTAFSSDHFKGEIGAKDVTAILKALKIRAFTEDEEGEDSQGSSNLGSGDEEAEEGTTGKGTKAPTAPQDEAEEEEEVDELIAELPAAVQRFIRSLDLNLDSMKDQDAVITAIVDRVQEVIAQGSKELDSAKAQARLLGEKLGTLEPELTAVKEHHKVATTQLDAAQKELETQATRMKELEVARAELKTTQEKVMKAAVTPLQAKIAEQEEALQEMDAEQQVTNKALAALKTDKEAIEGALDEAGTQLQATGKMLNAIHEVLSAEGLNDAKRLARIGFFFTPEEADVVPPSSAKKERDAAPTVDEEADAAKTATPKKAPAAPTEEGVDGNASVPGSDEGSPSKPSKGKKKKAKPTAAE